MVDGLVEALAGPMLNLLRIRDLAIIDTLEVEFGPGLQVVTGETGAGKSILIGALQLVLGAAARSDRVRAGAERAEVEALFEVDEVLAQRLEAAGIATEGELVVRRVILASGRSRAYCNGRLITRAELRRLALGLVDISSQHQHQRLTDTRTHLGFLDAYAGHGPLCAQVGEAVAAAVSARDALEASRQRLQHRTERADLLRYQLGEVARLEPTAGELEVLEVEERRLRHAATLATAAFSTEQRLYGAERSMCGELAQVVDELERAGAIDPRLMRIAEQVIGARAELEDAARSLASYAQEVEADPRRLQEIEDRLHRLHRLVRRHGQTLDDLLTWRESAERELQELDALDDVVAQDERCFSEARDAAASLAKTLSERRRASACALGEAIGAQLRSLGMGSAEVVVDVAPASAGGLEVDGARLGPTGFDHVEFLLAPNRGEPPKPMHQIASGGELSRALLGLKAVLAQHGPAGVYVFDEVDTGVGGAVAESIGRKIHEVSRHHQVLCITHLPHVAAFADRHLQVRKGVVGGRTRSTITALGEAERREELARMLGGRDITAATRAAADDLLAAARRVSP